MQKFMVKMNSNVIKLFFLILAMSCFDHVLSQQQQQQQQQQQRIEVSRCTKYKKQIFEKTTTYSFFIHGAAEVPVTTDNCRQYSPFIVDGTPASPKEFPHMARLGVATNKIDWYCGGTLISPRYVLTAAHCFYPRRGELNRVRLGELDFNSNTDDARPTDFGVRTYIEHPSYNYDESYNDIGLVELDRIVNFDEYIHPACLPVYSGDEFDKFIAIGWGSTRFASAPSSHLLKVNLKRYDYQLCTQKIHPDSDKLKRGVSNTGQICAGSEDTKDTCSGDSGGPLLAYHTNYPCMYYVVGVTSTGISCGSRDLPGLYTRVNNYLNWINSIVWQ